MQPSMPPIRRALTHPLWWAALAVLVLNDQVLKFADVLPGGLTGKLSDFAGLLVAPALLAALTLARSRRAWFLAHIAVGLGFTAINTSVAAASWVEAITAPTWFPWFIAVDPTDLVALPMLAVSAWRFGPQTTPARRTPSRLPLSLTRALQFAGLGIGLTASVATSPAPCDDCGGFRPTTSGAIFIANETVETQNIRVRRLRTDVLIDCEAVMEAPQWRLSRAHFDQPEIWMADAGTVFGLSGQRSTECHMLLVDGTHMAMTLFAWWDSDFFPTSSPLFVVDRTADDAVTDNLIQIETGGRVATHPAAFGPPPLSPLPATEGCEPVDAMDALSWSEPRPSGARTLAAITTAPGGCMRLDLNGAAPWYLCMPQGSFPFKVGDSLWFGGLNLGHNFGAIEGFEIIGPRRTLRMARGSDLVPLKGGTASFTATPGCSPVVDECGNTGAPLTVALQGGGLNAHLTAGRLTSVAASETQMVHLVRGVTIAVGEGGCSTGVSAALGPYLESFAIFSNDNDSQE